MTKRDEETICREAIYSTRYEASNDCPQCPRCLGVGAYRYRTRPLFKCFSCGHQFSLTSTSGVHGMKITATQLFAAIDVCHISAAEMARHAGISYKTAWVLRKRLYENPAFWDFARSPTWKNMHKKGGA